MKVFVKKVLNGRAVFSKSKTVSYDIHFLEQTCIEQMYRILEALATKPKVPKSLDGRFMLRSFSRKFQPKTDIGLRFEVAQSFRLYRLNKRSLTIYPSLRSNLALLYSRLFLSDSNRTFLRCAKKGSLHATVR